jgi:hypothetical protein
MILDQVTATGNLAICGLVATIRADVTRFGADNESELNRIFPGERSPHFGPR